MPRARARDGTAIFYERSDPPDASDENARGILAIGPLGHDSRLWRVVTRDAATRGYTLLAVDNRGCGRSGVPWRPWALSTMAEDLVSVLDDAGFERVHLCGPSLGGLVAQKFATAQPERVGALVLAATLPGLYRLDLLPYPAIARALLGPLKRKSATRSSDDRTRQLLRVLVSAELASSTFPGSALWELAEELSESPSSARGRLWQLFAAATAAGGGLAGVQAPTLIFHGTRDRVVPPRAAAVLAKRIPASRVEMIEGAGHALVLERPREVTEKSLDFVGSHDLLLWPRPPTTA